MTSLEIFLKIVAALILILLAAHGIGEAIKRIGQPKVVGEMVAGIVLGPSLLGALFPNFYGHMFTGEVKQFIFTMSNLGLSFYMFLVGAEIDLATFRAKSLARAGVLSLTGIIPSMLIGAACGVLIYDAVSLTTLTPLEFGLFIGSALSITAFPMLARILEDMKLTRSPLGALALVAASLDDAAAWCLLALITAIAHNASPLGALTPILGGVAFVLIAFFVLKPILTIVARRTTVSGALSNEGFAIVLLFLMACVWFTDWIGIYSVFGGFILGASLPRETVFLSGLKDKLHSLTVVLLLPIFFVNSGLNTNVLNLVEIHLLPIFLLLLAVAFISKYVFCSMAMRWIGHSWREASAIGGLFNARGLMLLIFVNIGISNNLISQTVFSMLVLIAVVTTAAAMPIFSRSLGLHKDPRLVPATSELE